MQSPYGGNENTTDNLEKQVRCSTITHISESPPFTPPPTNTVFWSVRKTPAAPLYTEKQGGCGEVEEILRVAIPWRCVIP